MVLISVEVGAGVVGVLRVVGVVGEGGVGEVGYVVSGPVVVVV